MRDAIPITAIRLIIRATILVHFSIHKHFQLKTTAPISHLISFPGCNIPVNTNVCDTDL